MEDIEVKILASPNAIEQTAVLEKLANFVTVVRAVPPIIKFQESKSFYLRYDRDDRRLFQEFATGDRY